MGFHEYGRYVFDYFFFFVNIYLLAAAPPPLVLITVIFILIFLKKSPQGFFFLSDLFWAKYIKSMEIQFPWLSYCLVTMLTNSVKIPEHSNLTCSLIPLLPNCLLPHNLFSFHVLLSVITVILLYVSGITVAMENLKSLAWF